MLMRTVGIAATLLLIQVAILERTADACSCMMTGPACENFYRVDAVFEGTVMSIGETTTLQRIGSRDEPFRERLVRFQVHRGWKRVTQSEIDVVTGFGGGDCGYDFKVGVKYLVFGYESEGRINAGICSATTPSADAPEYLKWLDTLAAPAQGGRVFGDVSRQDRSLSWAGSSPRMPMDGVRIVLDGPDKTRETVARAGKYEFTNLPVGRYQVRAEFGETLMPLQGRIDADIADLHACAQRDLWTTVNGRIAGLVLDPHGEPAVQILVEAAPASANLDGRNYQRFSVMTDTDGRFEISGLPKGDYVVGVNLPNRVSDFAPYRRSLYTGADPERPAVITIGTGELVTLGTLKLPRASWVQVTGTITGGRPNLITLVEAYAIPRGARPVMSRQTDAAGAFTLRVPEGVYILEARSWDPDARRDVARGKSDPITVRGADVHGVNISLSPEP